MLLFTAPETFKSMRIRNNIKLTEEAQEKIDALVNDLLSAIDVDLLSNAEKIVYLKTILQHSIPKKESVSVNYIKAPDSVKWLLEQSDEKVDNLINGRVKGYLGN